MTSRGTAPTHRPNDRETKAPPDRPIARRRRVARDTPIETPVYAHARREKTKTMTNDVTRTKTRRAREACESDVMRRGADAPTKRSRDQTAPRSPDRAPQTCRARYADRDPHLRARAPREDENDDQRRGAYEDATRTRGMRE